MRKWLLGKDVFEENLGNLQKEIKKQGGTYEITHYVPFDENLHILNLYDARDPEVFFYGTLNMCKKIQQHTDWITYCNFPQYLCEYYYPRIKDYLINSDFIMLPFGNLSPRIFDIFDSNTVFCRPCRGDKLFGGQLFGKYSFEDQIWRASQDTKPEDIVVISSSKNIGREWRLVVSDRVITGSQYKNKGDFETAKVPQEVIDYGNEVLENIDYQPDPMWTLDICEANSQLFVLETGGSSCAGFYESDLAAIVTEVNRLNE